MKNCKDCKHYKNHWGHNECTLFEKIINLEDAEKCNLYSEEKEDKEQIDIDEANKQLSNKTYLGEDK